MLKSILSFFVIASCVVFEGCNKDNPTTPKDQPPSNPGKRNFTHWTIDTLYFAYGGQTTISSIWGSSATNVYAVGHDAAAGMASMWHYDGSKWEIVNLLPYYGGKISGPFDLRSIWGFDSTNIYAVGERIYQTFSDKPPYFLDSSFIIHFDGKYWIEEKLPKRYKNLVSIWGISPTDIVAGENYGIIYTYNGYEWGIDSTAKKLLLDDVASIVSFVKTSRFFLASVVVFNTDSFGIMRMGYKMLKYQMNKWQLLDSFIVGITTDYPKWGEYLFALSNETILSSGDGGIYSFDGKRWTNIFPATTLGKIYGTRGDHIFAIKPIKGLYHFNGSNWALIETPGDASWVYSGVWCTEDEVFISAHDGIKSYIIHGK